MLEEKGKNKVLAEIENICSENGNNGAEPLRKNKKKIFKMIHDYFGE